MPRPDVLIADRYRLVERIASGGMGSVWEARDERLQRRVALKQLHPQPGLSPTEAKLVSDRAMREARITARLHHPHAVPVYDVVDFDGQPCLIMQYLPSKSLQALIKERGVLPPAEVARIGAEVAGALAAAHQVGIVHRDVKPANVLIGEDGAAKITDFGISHAAGDVALTSTGMVTGTPAFLAPEVARGVESGPAADVFSLGSTLYAAMEGSPPFGTEENPMAMLHRVASGRIIAPSRSGPLADALLRMLAVDPDARPPMRAVADELVRVRAAIVDPASGEPTHRIDPTQRMATPPMAAEPPTTTVTLPAVAPRQADRPPFDGGRSGDGVRPAAFAAAAAPPPDGRDPRARNSRRGTLIGAAVVLVLLLAGAGILFATQLGGKDSPAAGGGQTTSQQSPSAPAPRTHSSSKPASSSAQQQQHQQSSAPAPKSGGNGNAGTASGTPVAAVQHYYSLLPDDTASAWQLLTSSFQNGRAGGRQSYDNYWGQIRTVTASNVVATGSSSVQATITYTYKTGRVVSERTNFNLVEQGHTWKIDSTS